MKHPVDSHPANRLAKEKSPYLLQHARNPVDWYAWGPEAFAKAKKENKMIFLSIGYSTCHWCHVMAHESFEDEEIARLLNRDFVAIKVDREERPDIDQLYMTAVQAMTGSGGWPLTAFLTPEGRPFAGGTYFPPEDRWGRAGMKSLLTRLAKAWKEKPEEMEEAGRQMTDLLQAQSSLSLRAPEARVPDRQGRSNLGSEIASSASPHGLHGRNDVLLEILKKGYQQFASRFDFNEGGFGGAPKFPRSHDLTFLLGFWKRTGERQALEMVRVTLDHMARGGIFDPIGGGFHRYSTDEHWLVPHFEKMLYDQAILAQTYLAAYQETREPFYAEVARDIFHYVLRDMTDPKGGFYSAEDADSEGEEGKFYVWRPEEIVQILGPETGRLFNEFYGVTDAGNFEHAASILHVQVPLEIFAQQKKLDSQAFKKEMAEARAKLFKVREKRIHAHKDDKILTAWNGMMISALASATQVMGDRQYAEAATRSADFILNQMQRKDRLLRRFREGEASIPAFQEDYAFLGLGLLDLYETTFDIRWLTEAKRLTEEMIRLFWDEKAGGFFYTATDAEPLLARSKEYYDGAVPSGNSIAALLMLRLGRMIADAELEKKAEALMESNTGPLSEYPMGYPQLLTALDFALGPTREIILAGDPASADFTKAVEIIRSRFRPRQVLIHHPTDASEAAKIESLADYLKNLPAEEKKTTVYICENHVCQFPTTDLSRLPELLQ